MKIIILSVLIFVLVLNEVEAKTAKDKSIHLSGNVINCHDGDTCKVSTKEGLISVRIFGIDAPELKQEHGTKSRDFLESKIKGKVVDLSCIGSSYNRKVCEIYYQKEDISDYMVRSGMAYDYEQYSKGKYSLSEKLAKRDGLGVWGLKNVVAPKCFRHKNSKGCNN